MFTRLSLPLESFHQHQGQTNDCAPFTAAMIINALCGAGVEGEALARAMNRPPWRWLPVPHPIIRRIPHWATFPWGMVDVLGQHGIRARWRFGASEAALLSALKADRIAMPIVGEFRPLWAHIRALAAHDTERGWGFVDPARREPLVWQSAAEFLPVWHNWGHLLVETIA